ncbi:hypothetical protein [Gelatiniphilus marinus]|uniref:Transmembrane protein n=1 Tax=Gelatiniphilus marinus TaxID=1759464 RepID=A0ABW5JW09_9FLAO
MIIKATYKLTALFLTFVLLANNINNVVIVIDFVINQDFIAKTLCIQKEEQKGCNGKCYLTQQLKTSAEDKNAPIQKEQRTELSHYILTSNRLKTNTENVLIVSNKTIFFFSQNFKPLLFVFKIKQPPKQLA